MSVTVEQDIKDLLGDISHKLDGLQKDVVDLKIGQARLGEKVEGIERDLVDLKENIRELKGSQRAQIWTLIGIIATALLGTVIRYIILPFPPQL